MDASAFVRLIWFVVTALVMSDAMSTDNFHFGADFEDDTKVVPEAGPQFGRVIARESGPRSAWLGRPDPKLPLGVARIEFEAGTDSQRGAEVVPESAGATNHVLRFWLADANVLPADGTAAKGRVQTNMYGNRRVRELRVKVRMFLPSAFASVKTYPKSIDWLTISEWWNNASWAKEGYPFRITVNILKATQGSGPLRLGVTAQAQGVGTKKWTQPVWSQVNGDFELPVDRWINLDYYFREGDASSGRFYLAARVDNGPTNVIFDVKNFTYHPEDPAPDGLSHFNPMKLYTSGALIRHVNSAGAPLSVLWDDLDVTVCRSWNQRTAKERCTDLEP